ncbi:MAG: TIGR01777 family oxidoreductase [Planctomycetota bacterium]
MDNGRVVIAGGSGFLGSLLVESLRSAGYDTIVLSRTADAPGSARWDARTLGDWVGHLDGARALVNLTGRTVDCVKTPDHCDEILRSRVESTRVLGDALQRVTNTPGVWVQMSTAHIYGDPPDAICDESSAFGFGLAPTVGVAWERACEESCPEHVRRVVLRTSFVVGPGGGALARLAKITRLGLGGTVGSGRQGMSWIHHRDMNAIFRRAIEDEGMRGAYLATSPNPVTNAAFMRTLRTVMGMPIGLPAMGWMVRIGAPLVLRTDPELALYGRYCVPTRLLDDGFEFEFADLEAALRDITG